MKNKIFILVAFAILPCISHAEILINEIAWQGYQGESTNEWIELYNDSSESINLDGWQIFEGGGSVKITTFSNQNIDQNSSLTLASHDYFVVCRTDNFLGNCDVVTSFGGSGLVNTGEHLILKNSAGDTVHSVDFSANSDNSNLASWAGMSSASTGTLSRFGSSWREGESTPKSQNISFETENDTENDTNEDTTEEDDNESDSSTTSSSSSSSEKIIVKPKGSIEAVKQSFVGVPVFFESFLTDDNGSEIRKGIYAWNMGDGTVLYKTKKEDFSYTYQYPGEYVVTLSFYKFTFGKDLSDLEPYIYDEHVIAITKHSLILEEFKTDGTVVLKNTASYTLDMSHWSIESDAVVFTVPKYTLVRSGKTITFPGNITHLKGTSILMKDAQGVQVSFSNTENTNNSSVLDTVQKSSLKIVDEPQQEEGLGIEKPIENNSIKTTSLVSFSEQRTMYIGLFALLMILIVIIIWVLFSAGKTKEDDIVEYRIIEE